VGGSKIIEFKTTTMYTSRNTLQTLSYYIIRTTPQLVGAWRTYNTQFDLMYQHKTRICVGGHPRLLQWASVVRVSDLRGCTEYAAYPGTTRTILLLHKADNNEIQTYLQIRHWLLYCIIIRHAFSPEEYLRLHGLCAIYKYIIVIRFV